MGGSTTIWECFPYEKGCVVPNKPEKKDLINKETHNQTVKCQIFNKLKQINNQIKEKIKPLIKEKEKEAEEIENKLGYNSIVTNREYPFCIYPEAMMDELFRL